MIKKIWLSFTMVSLFIIGYVLKTHWDYYLTETNKKTIVAQKAFVASPIDCSDMDMVYTGWAIHREYNGGINNGGITFSTLYECEARKK